MNGLEPVAAEAKRGDVLEPNDGEVLYLTTTTAGGGKYYDFQGEDGKKYPKARFETPSSTRLPPCGVRTTPRII